MHGLHYTQLPLDRAEPLRREAGRLRERLADASSRIVPVWRSGSLVVAGEVPRAVALPPGAGLLARAEEIAFLGLNGAGGACFAADVSGLGEAEMGEPAEGARFIELRRVGALLDHGAGSVLAYARGLLHWHRQHRFCGACGAAAATGGTCGCALIRLVARIIFPARTRR